MVTKKPRSLGEEEGGRACLGGDGGGKQAVRKRDKVTRCLKKMTGVLKVGQEAGENLKSKGRLWRVFGESSEDLFHVKFTFGSR